MNIAPPKCHWANYQWVIMLELCHLTWLPLLENNYIFWPFRKDKKSYYLYFNKSIPSCCNGSASFLEIFLDQIEFMSCRGVGKQKGAARVISCNDFIKLLTAGNLFCSGPKPERATEPIQVHKPIRSSGRWAQDQRVYPRHRQQSQAREHPLVH